MYQCLFVKEEEEKERQDEIKRTDFQTLFETECFAKRLLVQCHFFVVVVKERRSEYENNAQKQGNRVGFEDIVNDFMGIDQIIDSDEIETFAEFIPEKTFAECVEYYGIDHQKVDDHADDFVDFAVKDPVRYDHQIR